MERHASYAEELRVLPRGIVELLALLGAEAPKPGQRGIDGGAEGVALRLAPPAQLYLSQSSCSWYFERRSKMGPRS